MRSGLGAGRPLSRPTTARRLDTSRVRVKRAERSGLGKLRRAGRASSCLAVGEGGLAGAAATVRAALLSPLLSSFVTEARSSSPLLASAERVAVRGARASSDDEAGPNETAQQGGLAPESGAGDGTAVLLALALLLGTGIAVYMRRPQRH